SRWPWKCQPPGHRFVTPNLAVTPGSSAQRGVGGSCTKRDEGNEKVKGRRQRAPWFLLPFLGSSPQYFPHVFLVRLDARLAVGIDSHQAPFDDRRQHEHL